MPNFLESKLKQEYPGNDRAVYGTMNKIGAMHGNKITPKGLDMERKHAAKINPMALGGVAGADRPWWELPEEEDQPVMPQMEMDPTQPPALPGLRTPVSRLGPPQMEPPDAPPNMGGDTPDVGQLPKAPPVMDVQEDQAPAATAGLPAPIQRPYSVGAEQQQAIPRMDSLRNQGGETSELIAMGHRVQADKPKAWQQILGGVLSAFPTTRRIDVHPAITRQRQNLGVQQMLADEERKGQVAQAQEAYHQEATEAAKEGRLASVAQRMAAQKKPPTIAELSAMQFPDGKPVFTPEQITIIAGGGKLKQGAAQPKANPEDVNHWIAVSNSPASSPEQRATAKANIATWQETNKDKPDPAAKENTNQWIADSRSPDPAISGPAKEKLGIWRGAQKDQRPTIINQAAIPSSPAIDQAAVRYATTGELPPMGMGSAGGVVRSKIMDRAAEMFPEANLAANKSAYGADKGSQASLQKTADAVNAFEGLARKNLDRFVDVAKRTVDSGLPWANQVFRGGARMLGDPNAADFEAARVTAFTEIAKVLNNPTSSAVLSDSARKEAEGILSGKYTIPQLVSVANLIKQEMATRKTENQRALDEIRNRMKGGNSAPAETGGGDVVRWGRDAKGNPVRLQ